MADVNVIGDEIHFDGYLVAILVATGIPATAYDSFVDGLANATLFEEEDTDLPRCPECKVEPIHKKECSHFDEDEEGCGGPIPEMEETSEYDCAMDDLLRSMKPFAKGGLLKYADLERIVAQLKEEKEVEATAS